MARERKLQVPVTLFASIETEQHEALRKIAFERHCSIADVVRNAISSYVEGHKVESNEVTLEVKSNTIRA